MSEKSKDTKDIKNNKEAIDPVDHGVPDNANGSTDCQDNQTQSPPLSLQEQLDEALKKSQDNHDLHLRSQAEIINIRRRHEEQLEKTRKFILEDFALAVCDIRDCLESALDTNTKDVVNKEDSFYQGVSLTLRKLITTMDSRHIVPIRPDIGANFDPSIHMAIGSLPASNKAPADTVGALIQSGYLLNGRVIRAATVQVATDQTTADNDNEESKRKKQNDDKKSKKKDK